MKFKFQQGNVEVTVTCENLGDAMAVANAQWPGSRWYEISYPEDAPVREFRQMQVVDSVD